MQFLEKNIKKIRKHRDNLSQQTEEETIWCQNQIIILQKTIFTENLLTKKMKKTQIYINFLFKNLNTRIK